MKYLSEICEFDGCVTLCLLNYIPSRTRLVHQKGDRRVTKPGLIVKDSATKVWKYMEIWMSCSLTVILWIAYKSW